MPASTGVFFNGYADRLAIQARMTLGDVGLYGVGYRLSLIVGLTLIGFQGALMPLILRRHEARPRRSRWPASSGSSARWRCGVDRSMSTFADEICAC